MLNGLSLIYQESQALAPTLLAAYLKPMTLPADIQDMIDDFAFLSDWEERYTHVIDMGKNLAPLAPSEKNAASKVKGCVSQVWLCLLYTSPSPRDGLLSRMPSSA